MYIFQILLFDNGSVDATYIDVGKILATVEQDFPFFILLEQCYRGGSVSDGGNG